MRKLSDVCIKMGTPTRLSPLLFSSEGDGDEGGSKGTCLVWDAWEEGEGCIREMRVSKQRETEKTDTVAPSALPLP